MKRERISLIASLFVFMTTLGCGDSVPPADSSVKGENTSDGTNADHQSDVAEWAKADGTEGDQDSLQDKPSMEWTKKPAEDKDSNQADLPEIKVDAISHEEYTAALKTHKGKVVLVDFWATWCIPCRKSFPHTVDLAEKYRDQGLVVISIACDDEIAEKQVRTFLADQKADGLINYRSATGSDDETFSNYEIGETGLPHYKLYGKSGELLKTYFIREDGTPIDEKELEETLKSAL